MSFPEGTRSLPEAVIRAAINAVQARHGSLLTPETVAEDERAIREIVAPLRKAQAPVNQAAKQELRAKFLATGSRFRRETGRCRKKGKQGESGSTIQIIPSSQK